MYSDIETHTHTHTHTRVLHDLRIMVSLRTIVSRLLAVAPISAACGSATGANPAAATAPTSQEVSHIPHHSAPLCATLLIVCCLYVPAH